MVWRFCTGDLVIPSRPSPSPAIPTGATIGEQTALKREHKDDLRSYEDALTRNDKAIGIIKEHIAPEQNNFIESLTTAKEVWDKLKAVHAGTSTGMDAFYTKRGMMEKRYSEGDDMSDHLNFFTLENKKLSDKDAFSDLFLAQLMLMSLPRDNANWETLTVVLLSSATDTAPLTTLNVSTRLMQEWKRLTAPDEGESANVAHTRSKNSKQKKQKARKLCGYCHKGPHPEDECRKKKKDQEDA